MKTNLRINTLVSRTWYKVICWTQTHIRKEYLVALTRTNGYAQICLPSTFVLSINDSSHAAASSFVSNNKKNNKIWK